jgi:hypothetical protein
MYVMNMQVSHQDLSGMLTASKEILLPVDNYLVQIKRFYYLLGW